MDCVRLTPADSVFPRIPCCRCADATRPWDRICGKTYCPNCLESLALGEGRPISERTDRRRCAVCNHVGTVRFMTFPLHSRRPVEMDMCGEHLRDLLGRCLGPHAFEQLRRQLYSLGLETTEIFLLHDAFYDENGHALQPASEWS